MGKWIYYVEDDTSIRELVLYALKTAEFQVMGFENAASFYKRMKEQQPDLILLDIMLPDEDGVSILKKLKSRPDTENIPVIMMTAKSSEYDKVLGLDSGADDYITKPFGVMELISRVKAVIRRSDRSKGSAGFPNERYQDEGRRGKLGRIEVPENADRPWHCEERNTDYRKTG